jgi:hypothetical protein
MGQASYLTAPLRLRDFTSAPGRVLGPVSGVIRVVVVAGRREPLDRTGIHELAPCVRHAAIGTVTMMTGPLAAVDTLAPLVLSLRH